MSMLDQELRTAQQEMEASEYRPGCQRAEADRMQHELTGVMKMARSELEFLGLCSMLLIKFQLALCAADLWRTNAVVSLSVPDKERAGLVNGQEAPSNVIPIDAPTRIAD
jgi:hypothetical protein